jgi:DNA-binding protein H-NS
VQALEYPRRIRFEAQASGASSTQSSQSRKGVIGAMAVRRTLARPVPFQQSPLRRSRMPKSPTSAAQSVEEIQAQLAQLEANEHALREALRAQQAAEFAAFIDELREQIRARGYGVDDVVAQLSKGRRGRSAKRAAGDATRYVDPENLAQTYSRGPLPTWLREKMEAAGYDPADKAQREEFKASYLQLAA